MYGSILSALLMGMVPVWGLGTDITNAPTDLPIAPPASELTEVTPVLTIPKHISASGILILDLESGQVMYQRNSDTQRPMASLTKLMTALLIVEHHDLDEWVTVPSDIAKVPGTVAHLPAGEQFTVGDLLSALLIDSANDAAVVLARYHSGTAGAFVEAMNTRAQELGLKHTSYVNPMGLDAPDQLSTPQDVGWLTLFVWNHSEIAKRMSMRGAQIHGRSGTIIALTHTHALMHAPNSDVIAGKTGTTDGAGQCLLSIVEKEDRDYIVILLHSSDRYTDMRRILDVLVPS